MDHVDAVVIGAGVVGLAIARALAMGGLEVIILEGTGSIGSGTSSRNSEVIHAGIYYPTDSLKAQLCVRGKTLLYEFCADHKVEHARCGKLLVASGQDQILALDRMREQATINGVLDLLPLSATDISALEPDLYAIAGLLSPSTGIVDSHGLMLALLGDAEEAGAMLALRAPFASACTAGPSGFVIETGGDHPMNLHCDVLVNSGGLEASRIARRIEGMSAGLIPNTYYAKGNYFALSGARNSFRHLIYPVPEAHGLGVHLTLDLAGQARFGPDVEWIDNLDYEVDATRIGAFEDAIRRYWPGLPSGALSPAYSGIRPKLHPPGGTASDFMIQGSNDHGLEGLVNLFGIESPGLTASLAIAEIVKELV